MAKVVMSEHEMTPRTRSPEVVDLTNEVYSPLTRRTGRARRKPFHTGTYIDLTRPTQSVEESGTSTSASSNDAPTDVEVLFELRRTTPLPPARIGRQERLVTTVNLVTGCDVEVVNSNHNNGLFCPETSSSSGKRTREEEAPSLFCPICLETYAKLQAQNVSAVVISACSHVFCKNCIEEALKEAKSCPKCRRPLRSKKPFKPLFF